MNPIPPPSVIYIEELVRVIKHGLLPATELEQLATAIDDYRTMMKRVQAQLTIATLRPGSRVRISAQIRPKYIAGATGTVRTIRNTKAVIELDQPCDPFQYGVNVPMRFLEILP